MSGDAPRIGDLLRAFFEDLARGQGQVALNVHEALTSKDVPIWVDDTDAVVALRQRLTSPNDVDALARFVREMVHAAQHSVLVSIDGGAASAKVGGLRLVDGNGSSVGDALHELYIGYLFETGRIA